jgi:hypothetical protein
MVEVSNSDMQNVIKYLEDAAKLYEALATLPMQKCTSRAYMINRIIVKLKNKLNNDQAKHY